jgi:hypothetical protein
MSIKFFTAVYRMPEGTSVTEFTNHPLWLAGSWGHALQERYLARTISMDEKVQLAVAERDQFQDIADQQLQVIKGLTKGCEAYGLTEPIAVIQHLGRLDDDLRDLRAKMARLERDAELGRTAMRFVDRAGDVHPGFDDADTICDEFYQAMAAVVQRQVETSKAHLATLDTDYLVRAPTTKQPRPKTSV